MSPPDASAPYSREAHIKAAQRARALLDAADGPRKALMWATLANGLVCLAIGYELLHTAAAAVTLAAWSWFAARAVVTHRAAHKAITTLNRMNRDAP